MNNVYSGLVPYVGAADAIATAPLPPAVKKTALRRLYESALAQDAKAVLTHPTTGSIFNAARGGAEGGGVGYLLGLLAGGSHAKYADLAAGGAAAAGLLGSLIPGNPVAQDFHNAGVAGAAILAYRRGEAKERAKTGGAAPAAHGENGPDDPTDNIVKIAKKLGIDL